MDASLLDEFARGLGPILAKQCTAMLNRAVAPLIARIAELEGGLGSLVDQRMATAVGALRAAEAGKSLTVDDLRPLFAEMVAALPKPERGKSVTVDDVRSLIDDVVDKAVASLPKPENGKDIDPATVAVLVSSEVDRAIAALPKPVDGKSVTTDDVCPILLEMVTAAVAKIPPAPAGKDVDPATVRLMVAEEVAKIPAATNGKDADLELIARMVDAAVAKIPPAPAGKDVDPATVAALVTTEVERAVSALPKPENGRSITIDDVRPLVDDLVGKAVAALPKPEDGADGVGLASAIIGRDGELILTLTNGSTKSLGVVVGRDADQAALAKQLEEMVAKFPKPKDGKDGLGFDDLSVESDGERTVTIRFMRGDQIKEFKIDLPVQIDRGVWREGSYKRGDCVSLGGSTFTAQRDTSAKPETNTDWRLSAKRGRDGVSAYDVARKAGFRGTEAEWVKSLRGEPGKRGDPGRDLTQMAPDGTKW